MIEVRAGDVALGQTIREVGMDVPLTVEHIEWEGDTVYLVDENGAEARLDRDTVVELVHDEYDDPEPVDDPLYLSTLYAEEASNPL